jgi:hypothetical protein
MELCETCIRRLGVVFRESCYTEAGPGEDILHDIVLWLDAMLCSGASVIGRTSVQCDM